MSSLTRAIQVADSERIFLIIEESRKTTQFPIGPIWSLAHVAEECRSHHGWVSVAPDNKIEAFILYREGVDSVEITFLATSIDARGHGRMHSLLLHLVRNLKPGNAVWLEVHENNLPARRLYEKIGFQEVGRRPKYYADGGAAVLYNYV